MATEADDDAAMQAVGAKDMVGLMAFVEKAGKDAKLASCPLITVCAESDFTAGVLRLIEEGADVNACDEVPRTALFYAQSTAAVEALLAAGADKDAKEPSGVTPLFHWASDGRNDLAAALIDAGADVNAADELHFTPLINASMAGHKRMVELLMAAGADAAHKCDGRTAEEWAIKNGHAEVAAIIRAGAEAAASALAAERAAAAEEEKEHKHEAASVAALPPAAAAFDDAIAAVVAERKAAVASASLADVSLASATAVQQLLLHDKQTLRADARVTAACDAALAAAAAERAAVVGVAAADDALRNALAAAEATEAHVASVKAAWQRAGELTHRSRVLIAGDDCDTIVDGGVLQGAMQAVSAAADEARQAEEAVEAAHAALHKARDEAEGMAELAADGDEDAKAELAAAKAQVKRAKKAVAKAGIVAKKKARAVDAAPIALRSAHHALLSRCHEEIGGALSAATGSEGGALCVLSAVHARWLQLLDEADKAAAEQAAADAAAASEEEGKDAADGGFGTVIGIYTLRSRLSVGRSMNTLWRATDSVGNVVVVKLLDDVSAFRRECNAIKTLHAAAPGAVVQLLHAEESVVVGGSIKHALVMPAGDWDMLAWCKGDHSEAERKGVLGRFALALAAVHGAGFVHGDVKPDNFVAFRSGSGMVWKLVDFGNAAAAGDAAGREMTVAYAAPEVAEAAASGGALAASPSSDVWSFGMSVLTVLRRGRTLQGDMEDAAWLQALRSDKQLSLGSLGSGSAQRLLRGRCLRKAADDRDSMERICLSSFVRATSTATSVAAGGGSSSGGVEEDSVAAVLLGGVKDALASSLAAAGEEQRALLSEALAAAEARRLAELGGLRSQLAEMAAAAESADSATAEQLAEVGELMEALAESSSISGGLIAAPEVDRSMTVHSWLLSVKASLSAKYSEPLRSAGVTTLGELLSRGVDDELVRAVDMSEAEAALLRRELARLC